MSDRKKINSRSYDKNSNNDRKEKANYHPKLDLIIKPIKINVKKYDLTFPIDGMF